MTMCGCYIMPDNRHERWNLGARYRKGIEANFLVEKHQATTTSTSLP